jgi:hypothetical protein
MDSMRVVLVQESPLIGSLIYGLVSSYIGVGSTEKHTCRTRSSGGPKRRPVKPSISEGTRSSSQRHGITAWMPARTIHGNVRGNRGLWYPRRERRVVDVRVECRIESSQERILGSSGCKPPLLPLMACTETSTRIQCRRRRGRYGWSIDRWLHTPVSLHRRRMKMS